MVSIGQYQLIGQVAQSGASTIWKANDPLLDRFVALKQLIDGRDRSVLDNEARTLARLDHPHIVRVIEVIDQDEVGYLVEEWVEGAQLGIIRDRAGALSPAQAVGVVRGALQGLAFAHDAGVSHGDVSPANILVDLEGVSKLIDFGATEQSLGTAGYRAPELVIGGASKRADVYSAAAVLADLLHPGLPTAGETPSLDGIPAALAAVLAKALERDPADRHADAGELLRDLEDAAERSLGPGWLALAGMSGLVSAALGGGGVALVATSGETAGTAIASVIPLAPAVVGAAKNSRKWLLAGAGAAAVVIIVVVISLIASSHSGTPTAAPGTPAATTPAAAGSPAATSSASPTAVTTNAVTTAAVTTTTAAATTSTQAVTVAPSTPMTSPTIASSRTTPTTSTSVPARAAGFNGTYTLTTTVVKSNIPGTPVGLQKKRTWKVTSPCRTLNCTPVIVSSSGSKLPYVPMKGKFGFTTKEAWKCVDSDTDQPTGATVDLTLTTSLTPTLTDGLVTGLKGTEHDSIPACPTGVFNGKTYDHADPAEDAVWNIVITRTGP